MSAKVGRMGMGVRLVILDSPYRLFIEPLLEYIDDLDTQRKTKRNHFDCGSSICDSEDHEQCLALPDCRYIAKNPSQPSRDCYYRFLPG